MRIRQIFIVTFFTFFFFACSTKKNPDVSSTDKDSVVREFLEYSSKIKFYDTTNYNYKLLKAHIYNDTVFLKQVLTDIERSKKDKNNGFPDSIRRHPEISKMEIDEAYQVSYSKSFCDLILNLTISKKGDTVKLNSVIYQENREPAFLKVVKENEKKLSLKNWEEFEDLIFYADFWGLIQYKESIGFDGDYLTVEAIHRNRFDHKVVRQHKVDRRFVSNTALYSAYSLLTKFANIQKGCYH
jgi:hypothetical protein